MRWAILHASYDTNQEYLGPVRGIGASCMYGRMGCAFVLACGLFAHALDIRDQEKQSETYSNPILFSDYSDPDVIRDGNHYYLVASTFHFVPGLPILQSTDLVHWKILGHALPQIKLDPRYDMVGG